MRGWSCWFEDASILFVWRHCELCSGLALRVHVSPECKALLDQLGGYQLIDRGPTNMKGKGTINTYFLSGKIGYDKSLPDLTNAAGLDQHEFK